MLIPLISGFLAISIYLACAFAMYKYFSEKNGNTRN